MIEFLEALLRYVHNDNRIELSEDTREAIESWQTREDYSEQFEDKGSTDAD